MTKKMTKNIEELSDNEKQELLRECLIRLISDCRLSESVREKLINNDLSLMHYAPKN